MPISFAGQVALVTGAGRGLGRSHAIELARRGASVVVNDFELSVAGETVAAQLTSAHEVVDLIEAAGGQAIAHFGDVSAEADAQAMVDLAMAQWGRLDIVVNNAGNIRHKRFSETTAQDLMSQLRIHVLGSHLVTRAAWPHMIAADYGRIIFTTSQVGMYGQLDAAGYGAAKAGVSGLMHGIKMEATGTGIRVNCFSPFALTRMAPAEFPRDMAVWMGAEQATPAVIVLADRDCPYQGATLIAGGGHFALATGAETRGFDFAAPAEITAEALHARLAELVDWSAPLFPQDAIGAVQMTFDRLGALR